MTARVLVVDNYDSFVYNLVQALEALGASCRVLRNDEATPDDLDSADGLLVSPGPGRPEDAGASISLLREAVARRLPTLGVCLGHQALAQAFGGRIVRAPAILHGKTSLVRHNGEGLFAGVPDPMQATRYHSLALDPSTLPAELEITATTDDGTIMALRHRTAPVQGVQFHPESVMTPDGPALLANFLEVVEPGRRPPGA